eukprot:GHVU01126654.1.p1 GENE.GHVU01126654.1~~GHVU01126654.1.p1  ORF type:complete len:148 (+),score=29.60 GHVU01126654.1:728-1171(+)
MPIVHENDDDVPPLEICRGERRGELDTSRVASSLSSIDLVIEDSIPPPIEEKVPKPAVATTKLRRGFLVGAGSKDANRAARPNQSASSDVVSVGFGGPASKAALSPLAAPLLTAGCERSPAVNEMASTLLGRLLEDPQAEKLSTDPE